jgi:hypothetical protein
VCVHVFLYVFVCVFMCSDYPCESTNPPDQINRNKPEICDTFRYLLTSI